MKAFFVLMILVPGLALAAVFQCRGVMEALAPFEIGAVEASLKAQGFFRDGYNLVIKGAKKSTFRLEYATPESMGKAAHAEIEQVGNLFVIKGETGFVELVEITKDGITEFLVPKDVQKIVPLPVLIAWLKTEPRVKNQSGIIADAIDRGNRTYELALHHGEKFGEAVVRVEEDGIRSVTLWEGQALNVNARPDYTSVTGYDGTEGVYGILSPDKSNVRNIGYTSY